MTLFVPSLAILWKAYLKLKIKRKRLRLITVIAGAFAPATFIPIKTNNISVPQPHRKI